jgi:CHASE3 domain sensor protein
MLENSGDILNISIAIAVLVLAFVTAWAIYYFAMLLRQGFKIVKEMRERLYAVDELVHSLKDKIEHSTSYLFLMAEGVKKLTEAVKSYTEKKEKKKDEQ